MAIVSFKKYKCTECGNIVELSTNHYGLCYPICIGKCRQVFEGNNKGNNPINGGFLTRKQTAHVCLEKDPRSFETTSA